MAARSRQAALDTRAGELAARERDLEARAAELDQQQLAISAQRRTAARRLEPVPEAASPEPTPVSFAEGLRRLAGDSGR